MGIAATDLIFAEVQDLLNNSLKSQGSRLNTCFALTLAPGHIKEVNKEDTATVPSKDIK